MDQFDGQETESEYSLEVHDILTTKDGWVVSNGIYLMTVVVSLIMLVAYFIRYPDMIKANITITSLKTPADIQARASGRLHLFITDNEEVDSSAQLGYIMGTFNYGDVVGTIKKMKEIEKNIESGESIGVKFSKGVNLGELQTAYLSMLASIDNYETFVKTDKMKKIHEFLQRQISHRTIMKKQLERQISTTQQELDLAKELFTIDSVLYVKKVIPLTGYSNAKGKYFPVLKTRESADRDFTSNEIALEDLKNQDYERLTQNRETKLTLLNSRSDNFYAFKAKLLDWERTYLLISPIRGLTSFFKFWNNNQNVELQETVMTVVPKTNGLFAYALLPIVGSAKVKTGQAVNIKLDNYPFEEYGVLRGNIDHISVIPKDGNYAVRIKITNRSQKISLNGRQIDFKEQMKGTAEIITEDLRLLERLFFNTRAAIKNMAR